VSIPRVQDCPYIHRMMVTQKVGCGFEVTWQRRMVGARPRFLRDWLLHRDPQ
jgi:hypothetical protein